MTAARLVRVAFLVVAVLTVPGTVGAADSLGARLSPTTVVAGHDSAVSLTNKSTIPVAVHVETIGNGWALDATDFDLGIGEARTIAITAGSGDAIIRTTLGAKDRTGIDQSSLVLETKARQPYPWESLPVWWPLLPLIALAAVLAAVRRRRATA